MQSVSFPPKAVSTTENEKLLVLLSKCCMMFNMMLYDVQREINHEQKDKCSDRVERVSTTVYP